MTNHRDINNKTSSNFIIQASEIVGVLLKKKDFLIFFCMTWLLRKLIFVERKLEFNLFSSILEIFDENVSSKNSKKEVWENFKRFPNVDFHCGEDREQVTDTDSV